MMKNFLAVLICGVFFLTNTGSAISAEKNINVPPVGVKEKFVPTPEEIHQDVPVDQKCSSCHTPSNQDIESKSISHFMTHRECDQCHLNKSWIPLKIYRHLSGKYRANSSPQECDSCHTSNSEYRAN